MTPSPARGPWFPFGHDTSQLSAIRWKFPHKQLKFWTHDQLEIVAVTVPGATAEELTEMREKVGNKRFVFYARIEDSGVVPASDACAHKYPPGCREGTARCWLCDEPDALPPRQAGPSRAGK